MAYKKYIRRGGKTFGPYYYESYRDSSGKVRKKYVGLTDPSKENLGVKEFKSKNFSKSFVVLGGTLILILFFAFSFYSFNNSESFDLVKSKVLSGYVVSSGEEVVEKVIEKEEASLEIKSPLKSPVGYGNKNKRMDFSFGSTNIRLYFDKLNYSNVVNEVGSKLDEGSLDLISGFASRENVGDENKNISKERIKEKVEELDEEEIEKISESSLVEVKDFDIEVEEESTEDYKWGYKFRLEELDFLAKVDVSSNEEISIWDSYTLRIGNSLLSFSDLEAEGYIVSFEKPTLENIDDSIGGDDFIEEEFVDEDFNESFVEENNSTSGNVNESLNSSFVENNLSNEENLNESLNYSEVFEENGPDLGEENNSIEEEVNETFDGGVFVNEENESNLDEEILEENNLVLEEENLSKENSSDFSITGSVVKGMVGLVGNVVLENSNLEYENKISIYIERDFRDSNYSIGDLVYLDPTLIIIPITDAVHLDANKEFISNIYNETKDLDDVWSEVISNGEYVRATFEEALNNEKDITIYARSADNFSVDVEVYEKDSGVLIDKFTNITSEEQKTIYLTNLSEDVNYTQSTFDLKIVGEGSGVEFDWIVDPTIGGFDSALEGVGKPGGNNLVRLDNGNLISVWLDSTNRVSCAYSSNNGSTWTGRTNSTSGTFSSPSVATNGTRIYIMAGNPTGGSGGAIVYKYSDSGCPSEGWTWTSFSSTGENHPAIEYDGISNSYVMCYKSASGNGGFANLSANLNTNSWTKRSNLVTGGTVDSCGISVEDDGDIHLCFDNADKIAYYRSSNLFLTTDSSNGSIISGEISLTDCDISARNDNVAIVFQDNNEDLQIFYSSDNGNTFNNSDERLGPGADQYYTPTVCLDKYGTAQILYADSAGTDNIMYTNYTTSQGFFSTDVTATSSGTVLRRTSMICHNFPENNKITNALLEYLYVDRSSNLLGFDTQYFETPKPEVTASATAPDTVYTNSTFSVNITALDYDDSTFTGNARFYVNDVLIGYYVNAVNNGSSSLVAELLSGNFSRGDEIIVEVWANDSDYTSPAENLTAVVVSNIYPTFDNPLTTYTQNTSSTFSYDYEVSDLDGDTSFTFYDNTTLFDINSSTGEISFTPNEGQAGTYSIEINVSDGLINSTDIFTLIINDTTAPLIVANSTSPNIVYTNTSFEVNLTLSEGNSSSSITGYVQFYVNDILTGSVYSSSLSNNTSGLVGTLGDGNFSRGDSIIAEVWASDGVNNASKVNLTGVVVQNIFPTFDEELTTVNWNTSENWNYDYNATDLDGDTITFYDNTTLFDINSSTGVIFHETNDSIAGTYSVMITISDGITNTTDNFTYVIADTTGPILEILGPSEGTNPLTEEFNYSAIDASGTSACWYSLDEGISNSTIDFTCSNFTGISVFDGNHTWTLYSNDTFGNNNSASIFFTHDSTPPVVLNGSGMVENNSVGGSTTFFNWSVTDNLDANLTCYPTVDGVDQIGGVSYVLNNSNSNVTIDLEGGLHDINVTCYDNANNSGQFNSISYLVAIIHFINPSPNEGSILRYGNTTNFTINETEGEVFINNITIDISNLTNSLLTLNSEGDPVHSVNYTWALEPAHLSVTATGFNNTVGTSRNVTNSTNFVLLRSIGNTTEPSLEYSCPRDGEYVLNGSTITLEMFSDLDTLFYLDNLTIVDPAGNNYLLENVSSEIDVFPNYYNYLNYTFEINKTGEYLIYSNVTDYENQSSIFNYTFVSGTGSERYRINSSTVTRFVYINKCSRQQGIYSSGSDINFSVINSSLVDLNASIEDVLHNITLEFFDVNFTSNLSEAVSYVKKTNQVDPPSGKRRVALIELNSSLNYTNFTFVYNYSAIAYTLNNESSLGLYFCSNSSSCELEELNYTVNNESDSVVAVGLSNLTSSSSYFMLAEDGTTTETVTETVTVPSSGGGGGGTSIQTVYRDINILTPGNFELGLKDQIVVPVTLNNPEDITLRNIKLNASSSTPDIDPVFESTEVVELLPGENETVMLFLESHSTPGDYEVYLHAEVGSPNFIETETIHVRLVETVGEKETKERIVLAQDLFQENPQCLELNDLLIQAQKLLDEDKVNESRIIVQEAIYRCKQLVTEERDEFPLNLSSVGEWKIPIIAVLSLIVLALIIVVLTRKTKLDLKTPRDSKKKFFGIRFRNPFRRRAKRKKSRF